MIFSEERRAVIVADLLVDMRVPVWRLSRTWNFFAAELSSGVSGRIALVLEVSKFSFATREMGPVVVGCIFV